MSEANAIPVRDFTCQTTVRLISTAYIEEPALAPLADNEAERAILEELEGLTSARRTASLPRPQGLEPDELASPAQGYGWTYINAAFCYTRPSGNRFNGPERGAWYATYGKAAAETAQAEVAYHLTRELDATGVYENVTAYRELLAGFTTVFHDITQRSQEAYLDRDPDVAYPAGQALAKRLLAAGSNGFLYRSLRKRGGLCLAAFRPHLVQNVRQGNQWTFSWIGSRSPKIEKG